MAESDLPDTVAPVEGAIRNPANPHHFMVVQPAGRRIRIFFGDRLVADSVDALRVIEIGPLKGDADYFSLEGQEIAWAYRSLDFAAVLDGLYSFWGDNMRIVEGE